MMGVSPEDMVRELVSSGADIIGVNCGRGIADMPDLVKEIRKYDGNIPLMIQPNAGIPIFRKENPDESSGKDPEQGKIIYTESPEYMAEISISVINAGANIIGGCCGTTPEHIRQIAAIVKNRRHGIK
jgi:methionine synthase I (cobalamin-dependent)